MWLICESIFGLVLLSSWYLQQYSINTLSYGDAVDADSILLLIHYIHNNNITTNSYDGPSPSYSVYITLCISYHNVHPSLINMIGIECTSDHTVYNAIDNNPRIVAVRIPQKPSIEATVSRNYVLDTGFPDM